MMDKMKIGATIVLLIAAVVLAYFLLSGPGEFNPGTEVNQETFTHILQEANEVNILMDIRNVDDSNDRWAILQCGVDFAGSSGLAGKKIRYLSMDDTGCVAEDGKYDLNYCMNTINNGVTLYVQKGNETTFHSKAMVVGVQHDYIIGLCNIAKVG